MFYTGVRTGEAIALRWSHINLKMGTALITRSISAGEESSTKSGVERILKLLPKALEALIHQENHTKHLNGFCIS